MKTKALKWIWPALVALLVAQPAAAEVSIDEILRLHSAGLSTQSLLLVVQASDTPDTISTDQLTALLEAGVPDTVITLLVYQADAVAEDWQPVDVDREVDEYRVVTRTRYVDYDYYDPGWTFSVGVWWGDPYWWSSWNRPLYCDPWYDPWYGGWCATSYYSYGYGYYDPWYWRPRVCVNFGWYPFRYAWYPYWHDHHHGGYYAYYDHDYRDRGIYGRLRDLDRPGYRNTVNRTIVDANDGKSYRGTNVVRRGDAPLTDLTRDYTGRSKDVTRDRRTDLRDTGESGTERSRDLAGRKVDTRTREDATTRYERKKDDLGLKSYATDKSSEQLKKTGKVDSRLADKTQDRSLRTAEPKAVDRSAKKQETSSARSLFDRYGDQAKANAEKVERYRALKQAQQEASGNDRSSMRRSTELRRTAPDASSGRRPATGDAGVTRRTRPAPAEAAPSSRQPARVDGNKSNKGNKEKQSAPQAAPDNGSRRANPSAKAEPRSESRGSTARSGGRSMKSGSSRSSGSGDSRGGRRNP